MSDLLDFLETNLGGMGRNVRDWRRTSELGFLLELQRAALVQQYAADELMARATKPV